MPQTRDGSTPATIIRYSQSRCCQLYIWQAPASVEIRLERTEQAKVSKPSFTGSCRNPVLFKISWSSRTENHINRAIRVLNQIVARRTIPDFLLVLVETASIDVIDRDQPKPLTCPIPPHPHPLFPPPIKPA